MTTKRAHKGEAVSLVEAAQRLLENGDVDVVLGYTAGTEALTAAPAFVRDAAAAARLVFDCTCEHNLVNYLHRLKGQKVAIVVKGCDERSLVGLVQEKQIERDAVIVLGAPCNGVVDPRKVQKVMAARPLVQAVVDGSGLRVRDRSGAEVVVSLAEVLYAGCAECPVRNPRFADILVGPPVPQPEVPAVNADVAAVEAADTDARWAGFRREMSKCILCFACRNLCPACYCSTCFTDSTQPKWMSKTDDEADVMFFHLTRLLHLAGRCTGCGACVRGCPTGVNLRLYNDKLRQEVKEQFGFDAGMDPEAEAPLTCFRPDDTNDFIR